MPNDSLNPELRFKELFNRNATVVTRSPGRINLIGDHVDYLGGQVMPTAIDRHLQVAAAPIEEPVIRLKSDRGGKEPSAGEINLEDLTAHKADSNWLNYVVGVVAGYKAAGFDVPGFEAVITTDLPPGAGLSSSAALETACALLVEALTGKSLPPIERALICQKAEHHFAGVPCGLMDQITVGVGKAGHALMIDCRDLSYQHVPITSGMALVVADTRVKHSLADGEYSKRRADCEEAAELIGVDSLRDATMDQVKASESKLGERLFRRARHAITEMARVNDFSAALSSGDLNEVASLMRASHESLQHDFDVSCPELDFLVETAYEFRMERGLIGARMTGGGFGGATVNMVSESATEEFSRYIEKRFTEKFGHEPRVFKTESVDAAQILKRPA